ncbi:MAG: dockerin type I repeat-containing protein [Clostridia bacterium]|nr:dockerin type I repeat-containing protein [Clostridia bacterium]
MKRLISSVLALIIVLCAVPISAAAYYDPAESIYIGGIELKNDTVLFNGASKAVSIYDVGDDFDLTETGFAYFSEGNLLLSNFCFEGESEMGALIFSEGSLYIILEGENTLKYNGSADNAGIMVVGDLIIDGTGSLNVTAYMGIVVTGLGEQAATYEHNSGAVNISLTDEEGVGVSLLSYEQDAIFYLNGGKLGIHSKLKNGSGAGIACIAQNEDAYAAVSVSGGELYISNTEGGIAIIGADDAIYEQTYGVVDIQANSGEAIATVHGSVIGENNGGILRISGGYIHASSYGEDVDAFFGTALVSDSMEGDADGQFVELREKNYVVLGGTKMQDGDYLANGATKVSKTAPASSGYAYYSGGKLTLNNYKYKGDGGEYIYGRGSGLDIPCDAILYSYTDLEIEFIGECSLNVKSEYTEGIVVYGKLDIYGDSDKDTLDISGYYGIQVMSFGLVELCSNAALELGGGIINIDGAYGVSVSEASSSGNVFVEFGDCELTINAEDTAISIASENMASVHFDNTKLEINAGSIGIEVESKLSSIDIKGSDVKIDSYLVGIVAVSIDAMLSLEIMPASVYVCDSRLEISVDFYSADDGFATIIGTLNLDPEMNVIYGSLESKRIVIGSGEMNEILGDVNNDGKIDQYDYVLVKRHHFNTRTLTDDEATRADANKDGKVDTYDYLLIARHYFGTYVIK